jgi:hypothetical protein
MIPVFQRVKAVHTSDRAATVSAVFLYKSLKCELRLHLSPDVKLTAVGIRCADHTTPSIR